MTALKSLVIILLAALTISACSKDNNTNINTPGQAVSTLTARVDGNIFSGSDNFVSVTGSSLLISGGNSNGGKSSFITLTIPHYAGLSTYIIDTATSASYSLNGAVYKATSGSISIGTDNAVHTAGTFAFEAFLGGSTKSISEGSFDIYK